MNYSKCIFGLMLMVIFSIVSQELNAQWDYKPVEDTSFASRKFRIEASVGYSIRVGSLEPTGYTEYDEYNSDFKYGINFMLSLGYKIFGDNSGLSFDYSSFNKSNSADSIETPSFGVINISDELSISYYGLSYTSFSSFLNDKIILIAKIGLGLYDYKLLKEASGDILKMESSSIAYYTYLSGEYNLTDFLTLGISVNYINGSWNEFTVNGTQRNDLGEESGTRWDFNLGLRYYF